MATVNQLLIHATIYYHEHLISWYEEEYGHHID